MDLTGTMEREETIHMGGRPDPNRFHILTHRMCKVLSTAMGRVSTVTNTTPNPIQLYNSIIVNISKLHTVAD